VPQKPPDPDSSSEAPSLAQLKAELDAVRCDLVRRVGEQEATRRQIDRYQKQLRRLAAELSLSEARQRRAIAEDLHDHIGQALAFIKMKISQFQGDAMFCGFESSIAEIMRLLNQTIDYTRSLTLQISPPMLYEFGLPAALDWLAGQYRHHHNLDVRLVELGPVSLSDELKFLLYKSVAELLTNTVKHAKATHAVISVATDGAVVRVTVADDGIGFDPSAVITTGETEGFGLFSIYERLRYLGGRIEIESAPSAGTKVTLTAPQSNSGGQP